MNRKITVYLVLSITVLSALILMIPRVLEWIENDKIFERIQAVDHQHTEVQVVDKITRLVEETRAEPESAEQWGKLAENLYIHDYKSLAVICFKRAHLFNDQDFRWLYFCAVALDDLNLDECIEWYENAKPLKPEYPPLLIRLANRYLLNGDTVNAKQNFNMVIKSGLPVPHAFLGLAKIALDNNDLQEAEVQINKAVEMAPAYREARAVLADIYRRKGEKEKANETFKIMSRLPDRLDLNDPVYYEMVEEGESSFWCQVRGNNFLKKGEFNKAEEEFKNALQAKPNEASQTSLGYVYQIQKRYEAAMYHYNQALALNPKHTSALNNMAVIYYELGDTIKAISLIKEVLEMDPESIDAFLNLGTFLKRSGRIKESLKYFRRGMELAPADKRFPYQISWILSTTPQAGLRNGKEALKLAEIVCDDINFSPPASLDLLAAALAETGQYQKASELAEKAYKLASQKKDNTLAGEIKERQTLYKKNKPFRETNKRGK